MLPKLFFVLVLLVSTDVYSQQIYKADSAFCKNASDFITSVKEFQKTAKRVSYRESDGAVYEYAVEQEMRRLTDSGLPAEKKEVKEQLRSQFPEDSLYEKLDFDQQGYFRIFDRLDLKDNLRNLRLYYYYERLGAQPYLFISEQDLPNHLITGFRSPENQVENYIHFEESYESYFQMAVYHLIGDKFALYWHALYDATAVTVTFDDLKKYLFEESWNSRGSRNGIELDPNVDLSPVFEMSDEYCVVKICRFTEFGGLLRESLKISRKFPHTITAEKPEVVIPYECGIFF